MTNTNNTEPRARLNPKIGRALYEVSTLDSGTIVVKPTKISREALLVAEKAKAETASTTRVTD